MTHKWKKWEQNIVTLWKPGQICVPGDDMSCNTTRTLLNRFQWWLLEVHGAAEGENYYRGHRTTNGNSHNSEKIKKNLENICSWLYSVFWYDPYTIKQVPVSDSSGSRRRGSVKLKLYLEIPQNSRESLANDVFPYLPYTIKQVLRIGS